MEVADGRSVPAFLDCVTTAFSSRITAFGVRGSANVLTVTFDSVVLVSGRSDESFRVELAKGTPIDSSLGGGASGGGSSTALASSTKPSFFRSPSLRASLYRFGTFRSVVLFSVWFA